MILRNWTICKLQAVAEIQTGIAKGKKGIEDPIELPYLRVANVQDGHLDLSEIKTITVSKRQVERYLLRNGDVLLTEGGDYDKLGRGTVWHNQIQPCLHQNHIFVIRTNLSLLLPEFFGYQASSSYGKRYFLSCAKQTTNLASINSTQLKEFPVLVPPLVEQKRIAEVLATWDKAIAITEKLVLAKQLRLKALVQFLYSKFNPRSSESNNHTNNVIEFGKIFEEIKLINPGLTKESVLTVGKYAIRKQIEHFNRSVASSNLSNYLLINPGDFVYDPMSVYYGAIGRHTDKSPGIVSPAYRVIKLKNGIHPDFIEHLLNTPFILHELKAKSSQGNKDGKRRTMQRNEFSSVAFILPSLKEQQEIAAKVQAACLDVVLTERLRKKLQAQKRGLMQKLFTREWRVSVEQAA